MKKCKKCKLVFEKTTENFRRNKNYKDGFDNYCKPCRKAYMCAYIKTAKGYRSMRAGQIKFSYGFCINKYDVLYDTQGKKCAICDASPKHTYELSVDHDHTTGEVRGLICRKCNLLLGYAKDSTSILHKAINYLGQKQLDEVFA